MTQIPDRSFKANILMVDDTPCGLCLLHKRLMREGYRIWHAEDGITALRLVQTQPPDLILLDIMMPKMTGFEVCTHLKADPKTRDIPVIFMSALFKEEDKAIAFEVGGVDYITKPLHLQEVLVRVKTHLTLQKQQQQLKEQNTRLQQEVQARAAAELALQKANRELQRKGYCFN